MNRYNDRGRQQGGRPGGYPQDKNRPSSASESDRGSTGAKGGHK